MTHRRFVTILALVVMAGAPTAHAQFWTKRPYSEWSESDCKKMLTDSPWARSYTIDRTLMETNVNPATIPGGAREQAPRITYVARLLSAAPIRQAMVRNAQLDPRYATLNSEQKQKVEARHKAILEEPFPDSVVIQIEFSTNMLPYRGEVAANWQAQAEDVLKQKIFLFTPRGRFSPERIIIDMTASSGEIQLIFPRIVDGQPLIQPGDKSVSLEFQHPAVGGRALGQPGSPNLNREFQRPFAGVLPEERVLLEFKVKNMLVTNKLVF